ncbi:hypothetical protein HKX48_006851 [Thoreauomyces humboldtii]|nr:hypothetical protein HKX48_006851 [Thoreauomyces humboldtii]
MASLDSIIHRANTGSVSPNSRQPTTLPPIRQHLQADLAHHHQKSRSIDRPFVERPRDQSDRSQRNPAQHQTRLHDTSLPTLAAAAEQEQLRQRQHHHEHQDLPTQSPPSRPSSAASTKAPVPTYAPSHHSRTSSGLSADFDDLPQLKPPQLNNVQDISDTAWVSPVDSHPYVRIRLKTKGTLCRADFHDLSPKKQQELIERLAAKKASTGDADDGERIGALLTYMEKHKRVIHAPAKRSLPADSSEEQLQRKRLSPKAYVGIHGSAPTSQTDLQPPTLPAGYQFPARTDDPSRSSYYPQLPYPSHPQQQHYNGHSSHYHPLVHHVSHGKQNAPHQQHQQLAVHIHTPAPFQPHPYPYPHHQTSSRPPTPPNSASSQTPNLMIPVPPAGGPVSSFDQHHHHQQHHHQQQNQSLRSENAALHAEIASLRRRLHAAETREDGSIDERTADAGLVKTERLEAVLKRVAPSVHEALENAMRRAIYKMNDEVGGAGGGGRDEER